jgi:hypothetical protein
MLMNCYKTIDFEFQYVHKNKRWTLFPSPKEKKPITSKRAFQIKVKQDGSIDKYKTCVDAQIYTLRKHFFML